MLPETSIAQAQVPAITVRRSTRSDRRPTGYCVTTAARMLTAMNMAMLLVSSRRRAYTGPIEKIMEEMRPDAVIATTPSGELRYRVAKPHLARRCARRYRLGRHHDGYHGQRDQHGDQHEGRGVCGFDNTSKNCAHQPTYKTSMYTASSLPRFALRARSSSQLSATMYMPAKHIPDTRRIAPQATGLTKQPWTRIATEAMAARAANTRMCPICRNRGGAIMVPKTYPT